MKAKDANKFKGLQELLEQQREEFIKKFGRPPEPDDPLFFDPEAGEPTPFHADEFTAYIRKTAEQGNIRPFILYAIMKTGLMVFEENKHLLTRKDLKEWNEACAEGIALFGGPEE